MAKKINHRGHGGHRESLFFLCAPLCSLWFSEPFRKIIKSLQSYGNIVFATFAVKKKLSIHVNQRLKKQATPSGKQIPTKKAFSILAEGSFLHDHRMYFEVPANVYLKRIDDFLRDTWVNAAGT